MSQQMGERIDIDSRSAGSAIPLELREVCERGELIVCVGPELGRRAELPDAGQFALELLADIEVRGGDSDFASLPDWIAQGRIAEALEVLERRMGTRFQRVAERVLADRGRPLPLLAKSIAALSDRLRAVYTTGIDRLLERAFADEWPSFTSPRPDVARRSKLIFKLCGTLEFPDTWVLTHAAFEREFGERSLRRQLLATVFRAHCLLFIGFDPADGLTQRLFSIIDFSSGETQLPSHFVVLERCSPEWRVLLERRGLHVIVGESSAILEALGRGGADRERAICPEFPQCPYPGLRPFDGSLAGVFHGRRAEISQAAARLGGPEQRHRRWLAIDGSSGVGKSSFVHAGLIPALRRGFAEGTPTRWVLAAMRPGRRPFRALVCALETTGLDEFEQDTTATAATVAKSVRERVASANALLLVVDQLEEVVTLASPDELRLFVECLVLLLQQELIYLVTTLRSDFNAVLANVSPTLARLLNDHAERYTLAPISRVGLRVAIVEPAAQLGVVFEEQLVERIASDAEQHLDCPRDERDGVVRTDDAALPLVAHVLRGLWDAHAAKDGVITFEEYKALGGVSGALSRNADALLAALDKHQQVRVKVLLLRMAGIDGDRLTRRTLTRVEALALAGGGDDGERLLALLSGGGGPRLLVVRGEGEEALVDLIHEALLREWDTLRGWIAGNRAQLARDEALAVRASAWLRQGRPWRSLPRGPERRELLRGRPHGREADRQREYQRAMSWAGWLRSGAWVGFVAVLGWLGTLVHRELESARSMDEHRRVELGDLQDKVVAGDIESERKAISKEIEASLNGGRCGAAMHGILGALHDDPSEELRQLLREAVRCEAIVAERRRIDGSGKPVTAVSIDPTGHAIWVGRSDGSVDRWPTSSPSAAAVEGLAQRVDSIRFSPDGDRIALSSRIDGTTALRERHGKTVGWSFAGSSPLFSPDGRHVATLQKRQVNLHDAANGERLWSASAEGNTTAFEFSPTGDALIHSSSKLRGSDVVVRSLVDGNSVRQFAVPGYVRDISVSSDGQWLASAADDNYTRLWDLFAAGADPGPLRVEVRDQSLRFVRFSPDGSVLATLATNESIALDDQAGGTTTRIEGVDPRRQPIFSPNGRWLLTSAFDGTVNLRSATLGVEVARVEVANLEVMSFSPTSDSFVTGSTDGTVTQWGVDMSDHWTDPAAHAQAIKALAFSPTNPRQLASGSSAGTVHTWLIGTPEKGSKGWRHAGWALALAFSDDGTRLTSFSDQGFLHRGASNSTTEPESLSTGSCASKHVAASPSGRLVAIACPDGKVQLWDSARQLRLIELSADMDVNAIGVSDRGDHVVLGGSTGAIEVLKIASDAAEKQIPVTGHANAVTSVAFARAGDRFVTGSNDGFVRRWDLDDLEHPLELSMEGRNVEAVAISDTPARVAAGDDSNGVIIVWGDADNELLYLDSACNRQVTALQFSPDGQRLAAGCSDGTVHAWPIGNASQIELACQRLAHVSTGSGLPKICSEHKD